jgi:hypothetical protein
MNSTRLRAPAKKNPPQPRGRAKAKAKATTNTKRQLANSENATKTSKRHGRQQQSDEEEEVSSSDDERPVAKKARKDLEVEIIDEDVEPRKEEVEDISDEVSCDCD